MVAPAQHEPYILQQISDDELGCAYVLSIDDMQDLVKCSLAQPMSARIAARHCMKSPKNFRSTWASVARTLPRFYGTPTASGPLRGSDFGATTRARTHIGRFIISLGVVAVLGCGAPTQEFYYDSYALAVKDGAIQRGWLPLWLPVASTKIFVAHKVDTGAQMWAADAPVGTELVLASTCRSVLSQGLPKPHFERIWWPEGVPHARAPEQAYIYFKCGSEYIGLAAVGGKLVGWAVP